MIISISAFGEDQLSREILRVGQHAANIEPALAAVYARFIKSETELFDSEGSSGGSAWAPLKPDTVAYKAAKDLDPRILHATLTLRDSLTDPENPGAVYEPSPEGAFMGSDVSYGVYHQSSQARTGNLPRRPVVMLTEAEKIEWLKIVQRWIMTGTLE